MFTVDLLFVFLFGVLLGMAVGILIFILIKNNHLKFQLTPEEGEKLKAEAQRVLEMLLPIGIALVTEAEERYRHSGAGELKRSWVLRELYGLVPDNIKPLLTSENLIAILELSLDAAKTNWKKQ